MMVHLSGCVFFWCVCVCACVEIWNSHVGNHWISWFRISEKPQEIETACGVWLVVEPLKPHPRSTQQSAIKRLSFTCTCGPEGMHYSQVVVRVCLAPLSPKIQDPPPYGCKVYFVSPVVSLSLYFGGSLFLSCRFVGFSMRWLQQNPAKWSGKHGELKHDFRKHFKKTQLKRTISRHMIQRDFEVFFAVKHTSGITGDPVKVLQQSMTPKKGVYPQEGGIHHANLAPHKFAHIIWWLQISKTLASDFWGWTKLSINSSRCLPCLRFHLVWGNYIKWRAPRL